MNKSLKRIILACLFAGSSMSFALAPANQSKPYITKFFLDTANPGYALTIKVNGKLVLKSKDENSNLKKLFTDNVYLPPDLLKMAADELYPILHKGKNTISIDYQKLAAKPSSGIDAYVGVSLTDAISMKQMLALSSVKKQVHIEQAFILPEMPNKLTLLSDDSGYISYPQDKASSDCGVQDITLNGVKLWSQSFLYSLQGKGQNKITLKWNCKNGETPIFTIHTKFYTKTIHPKQDSRQYASAF